MKLSLLFLFTILAGTLCAQELGQAFGSQKSQSGITHKIVWSYTLVEVPPSPGDGQYSYATRMARKLSNGNYLHMNYMFSLQMESPKAS